MFSLNLANSMTKTYVTTVKGLKHATSCVREQDATTTLPQSNSCFSDLSDSPNSLKALLHLGKTSMGFMVYPLFDKILPTRGLHHSLYNAKCGKKTKIRIS